MFLAVSTITLTFDLSSASLFVKSFHIPALTHFKRRVDKHFKKWQPGTCVDAPCLVAILWEKRHGYMILMHF